ncbi:MAG: desulfoferrodoxin family protein, partial [Candidatus Hodarchaeales archaeon]
MGELYQTADWKSEKHVPAIIKVKKKEEFVKVKVAVGKEIPHPNTTEHHIKWIKLIFWPEGEKFPVEVGNAQFVAHGESAQGPNTSSIYTEPRAIFILKTEKGGKLIAT